MKVESYRLIIVIATKESKKQSFSFERKLHTWIRSVWRKNEPIVRRRSEISGIHNEERDLGEYDTQKAKWRQEINIALHTEQTRLNGR